MLEFFIEIVRYLLAPALLLAVIAGFVSYKKKSAELIAFITVTAIGFLTGIGIYIAKYLEPKKLLKPLTRLNRQLIGLAFVFLVVSLIIYGIIVLLSALHKKYRFTNFLFLVPASLSLAAMLATTVPFVLLKTHEFVAFGEDSFGTASLYRVGGYVLGALTLFLLGLSVYQLYKRMPLEKYNIFGVLLMLALAFDYCLKGISALARLGILKSSIDLVFSIMILDDKSTALNTGIYLGVIFLTALFVFLKHIKVKGAFATPAMHRKERWWYRNCRRWSVSAVIFAIVAFLSLTVVHAYITRPVELTPPQDYQETDRLIIVPLSDVDDGHLHRFSYEFEGHDVRFIVVRKPDSMAYGVGLDACDICGVAGYYERNDEVICKRCDVVMNKATIGFKGGCNPVPFNYEIKDGKIVIQKEVLEAEKDRFPKK